MEKPLLFLGLLIFCGAILAKQEADPAQQLEKLTIEIDTIHTSVTKDKISQADLFSQLKQHSLSISKLNNSLIKLQQQINQQSKQLAQIAQQQKVQQRVHSMNLSALNQQIRAAFSHSQSNFIAVLFNQHDPASFTRSSTYFHYFHQARQHQLSDIKQTLHDLHSDQKKLISAQRKQQQLLALQQQQQQVLQREKQQRQATLRSLEQRIASQDSRLKLLREQQQSLQLLLNSLANKKARTKRNDLSNRNFAKRVGSLLWPIQGKIVARYGSSRKPSQLKWQGIMIASPSGQQVKASAPGHIVFSDWLRGFGLLIIIDHGDQYMTLYGNNEVLLKQVGDKVNSGELIAQSGDNGIRQYSGLYFEIRHQGKPKNPLKWLTNKS